MPYLRFPLVIEEEDGSPTGTPVTLKVTNGTLTDNGDGTFSLAIGGGGGTPGGSDTQVQFNDGGSFGGDAGFTYNKTTDVATLGGLVLGTLNGILKGTTGTIGTATGGTDYEYPLTFTSPLSRATNTISLAGLSSLGTANYVVGANSGATGWEYKQILGTASEIDIAHAAGSITIGLVDPLAVTKGGTGLSSTTVNQILYSSAANTIAGLSTANSGVLVTSAGGVPSIATDIPTAVTIGSAYIYRVGGTDVAVADGGLNLSTIAAGSIPAANALNTYSAITSTSGLKVLENSAGTISWVATTGTGNAVLATSPTLVTPNIGAATGTSLNVTGGGLTISTAGQVLTVPLDASYNFIFGNATAVTLPTVASTEVFAFNVAASVTSGLSYNSTTGLASFTRVGNPQFSVMLATAASTGTFSPRVFNQASEPTTTQIPSAFAAFWTDTDDSKCYLCYNHGGTVKTVELI
jgi:hypothetical protein